MEFQILASSSKGNSYLVKGSEGSLLIEAGIPFKKIKETLDFNLSDIKGCLITHEHQDHAKSIKDIAKAGIDVYASKGTFEGCKVSGHRYIKVMDKQQISIAGFNILAFKTEHDCNEPLGFLLYEKETKEKLLFATDTYYIRYKFAGLNHIAVECNYCEEVLTRNIDSGYMLPELANRIRRSHFGLDNVIEFLKANGTESLKNLYLLHLSDGNSDVNIIESEIKKVYQGNFIIAQS